MKIKFWGVRGSTPTPERRNSRYGGNSPCIEVRLANGTIIILDCGSGLRGLGKSLLRCPSFLNRRINYLRKPLGKMSFIFVKRQTAYANGSRMQ